MATFRISVRDGSMEWQIVLGMLYGGEPTKSVVLWCNREGSVANRVVGAWGDPRPRHRRITAGSPSKFTNHAVLGAAHASPTGFVIVDGEANQRAQCTKPLRG